MRIQRVWMVIGLLAFGLILGEPVKASSPVTVSLNCPVDGTEFKVSEAGGMTVMGKRADLSLMGAIGSLYEGHVHSCPKCHFSGTRQDFKQVLTDDLKKRVLEQFANYLPGLRLASLSEVDLTLQMYSWQKRSPLDFIHVALNGSYLANSDEETYRVYQYFYSDHNIEQNAIHTSNKRRYYQALTAQYIEKAWKAGLINESDQAVYAYLAGEMLRRCSQFNQAANWYQQALATLPDNENSDFEGLIKQQLKLAKEHDNNDSL